mmetsp:Transcript_51658/g.120055  ORF Transcript_51658/g.120055 Transcript_51658/m.120055 type:complete len:291 (+) Transcript_51658:72-944(+)
MLDQHNVPCELDVDAVKVPFTRNRALGLQHELRDLLGSGNFQERLLECEQTHGKGTMEFRKAHQSLVLEAQASILPKYGFEGSMEGVGAMMAQFKKQWANDAEVNANIKEIDALIWKPHHVQDDAHPGSKPHHVQEFKPAPASHVSHLSANLTTGAFDPKAGVSCEIDVTDIRVPMTTERMLGLQHELLDTLGTSDFQARLLQCENELGTGTPEFRKQHQQLVFGVQREILPKYGFEASLEGVKSMVEAVNTFSDDPEIKANLQAINKLIWRSGPPPEAKHVDLHFPEVF